MRATPDVEISTTSITRSRSLFFNLAALLFHDYLHDYHYLMLFLSSVAGQMQSEKWQCGSSGQLELYPNQIEQFLIYAPDLESTESLQKKTSRLIQGSFAARKHSQAILGIVKRGVEMAIEQNEATLLKWMEQECLIEELEAETGEPS